MPATITSEGGTPYTFISLAGPIAPIALLVEDISRPGVDGHAYREDSRKGRPYEKIGVVDCDNRAAAVTRVTDLAELQGTLVSVLDDNGDLVNNVMVLEVEMLGIEKIAGAVGGLSVLKGALLRIRFLLQETQL